MSVPQGEWPDRRGHHAAPHLDGGSDGVHLPKVPSPGISPGLSPGASPKMPGIDAGQIHGRTMLKSPSRAKSAASQGAWTSPPRFGTAQPSRSFVANASRQGAQADGVMSEEALHTGGKMMPRKILGGTLGGVVAIGRGEQRARSTPLVGRMERRGSRGELDDDGDNIVFHNPSPSPGSGAAGVILAGSSIKCQGQSAVPSPGHPPQTGGIGGGGGAIALAGSAIGVHGLNDLFVEKNKERSRVEMQRQAQLREAKVGSSHLEKAAKAMERSAGKMELAKAIRKAEDQLVVEMRNQVMSKHAEREKRIRDAKEKKILMSHEARMRGKMSTPGMLDPNQPHVQAFLKENPGLSSPPPPTASRPRKSKNSKGGLQSSPAHSRGYSPPSRGFHGKGHANPSSPVDVGGLDDDSAPEAYSRWGQAAERRKTESRAGTASSRRAGLADVDDKWEYVGYDGVQVLGSPKGRSSSPSRSPVRSPSNKVKYDVQGEADSLLTKMAANKWEEGIAAYATWRQFEPDPKALGQEMARSVVGTKGGATSRRGSNVGAEKMWGVQTSPAGEAKAVGRKSISVEHRGLEKRRMSTGSLGSASPVPSGASSRLSAIKSMPDAADDNLSPWDKSDDDDEKYEGAPP